MNGTRGACKKKKGRKQCMKRCSVNGNVERQGSDKNIPSEVVQAQSEVMVWIQSIQDVRIQFLICKESACGTQLEIREAVDHSKDWL